MASAAPTGGAARIRRTYQYVSPTARAEAAGEDTTWQPLVATLSESNRVPLHFLLLHWRQCAALPDS